MHPATDEDRPRTALVAGGTGALGAAVVAELLARGEHVVVPSVVEAEAVDLASTQRSAVDTDRLRIVPCDATDPQALDDLLARTSADWGPLWLGCSVIGGWAGGQAVAELDDLTVLDRLVQLNLRSAFSVSRSAIRAMGSAGGRVVLVSAVTARQPAAGQAAYSATKAGVASLVATLREELRGTGRTATAVEPKIIDTPANRSAMPDADHDRWVTPAAIARVVAWLASTDAWVVNGAVVPVHGDA